MSNRLSRWSWLTIFAVCNLVCWVVVAMAVGLLVGDKLDLGVETLIRQQQSTVVAVWEEASQKLPRAKVQRTPAATASLPVQVETEAVKGKPSSTIVWPTGSLPSPTPRSQATPTAFRSSTPTPRLLPPKPTPKAEQALVSSPLLMSDPEITNLMSLNNEMSRSAPGRAVQIRYQEAMLNRQIAALVQNNPDLPYRDVQVDLKRDQVVVTGNVTVLGFQVSTEAVGTVTAQNCLPQMEIQTISIAGVLTPGFVKDQIKDMILEALAWYPADYPLCLEQIVLEERRATVYGHCR